jgi:hypothetical protein
MSAATLYLVLPLYRQNIICRTPLPQESPAHRHVTDVATPAKPFVVSQEKQNLRNSSLWIWSGCGAMLEFKAALSPCPKCHREVFRLLRSTKCRSTQPPSESGKVLPGFRAPTTESYLLPAPGRVLRP